MGWRWSEGRHGLIEFAGKRLVRLAAEVAAKFQIIFHGIGERLFEFTGRRAFEGHGVADVDHATVEELGFGVVFEFAN